MKNANKIRALLFSSLGIVALGVGFFAGSSKSYQGVYAASKTNIKVDNGIVELGSYPQSIVKQDSEEFTNILTNGQSNGDVYTYSNEKYAFINSVQYYHDQLGDGKYEDGSDVVNDGQAAFFKYEPIKWIYLYDDKDQNVAFLYAKYALDAMVWQADVTVIGEYTGFISNYPDIPAYDWEKSSVRGYLNNGFYNDAFDSKEKGYMKQFTTKAGESTSKNDVKDYASIISPKTFKEYKTSKNIKGGASDFAKSKALHYHYRDYGTCFIWLNGYLNEEHTLRVHTIRGNEIGSYDAETSANESGRGVRPMIALDLSKVTMGVVAQGGGSSSGGTNVALILGIIFSIFGIGGLVTFMVLWAKGKLGPKFSMKIIIPIIAAAVVVSSAGLICLASYTTTRVPGLNQSGGGVGCTFKTGYYLQSTAKDSGTAGGINFVQVGLSCYLFRADGTVSYCAAVEQEDASDFVADSGNGTWSRSGCTFKFNYTTPMGSSSATLTISGTKLLYNGREAYHWVRGE